ncbi:MAG: FAD-dependent oxidoreductase, partial [Chloroflexota bacterium]
MSRRVLVIGGSIEGVQAALDLADCGIEVTLIEASSALRVNSFDRRVSRADTLLLTPKFLRAASHPNIDIVTDAKVVEVKGGKGGFRVTVTEHPRYVNVDACTSCGRCELQCPANIIAANGENGHKAIHRPYSEMKSVPSTYSIEKKGVSPCTAACPAGVNAHGYVALIAQGKFDEALDLITESVPFPRVLGRVCNHPCEDNCTRAKIDRAVSICALKRFVANGSSTWSSLRRTHESNSRGTLGGPARVAIIGSGPAGLSAARDLARLGHRSTVFEALPVPGGMITVGMPRFRLPREVRQADIDDIVNLGIEIRTSTPIGEDLTLEDLRRQGYEAILVASGAHKNRRLGIPGENLPGVVDSVAFLQALNLKQPVTVGSRVVVIGGGNSATDSARVALRIGAKEVAIVYRRTRSEMPAAEEEIEDALQEGVKIEFLSAPSKIIRKNGRLGLECIRMKLGGSDKGGRRGPVPVEGSEFVVEADTVIVAVGQIPDLSFLQGDTALTEGRRHVVADPRTMATSVPGIFAAGDVVGRLSTMIEAVAAGRRAAISIDRFLRGEELKHSLRRVTPVEVDLEGIFIPPIEYHSMPHLEHKARVGNFEEVALGFDEDMAVSEASRCLNCGGCSECLECVRACELDAVDHDSVAKRFELEVGAIIATGDTGPELAPVHLGAYYVVPCSAETDLSQASAVAARVMVDLAAHRFGRGSQRVSGAADVCAKPHGELPFEICEPRIGVFVCGCGGGISEIVDVPDVVDYCGTLEDVAFSGGIGYACTQEAAEQIKDTTTKHGLTHV